MHCKIKLYVFCFIHFIFGNIILYFAMYESFPLPCIVFLNAKTWRRQITGRNAAKDLLRADKGCYGS